MCVHEHIHVTEQNTQQSLLRLSQIITSTAWERAITVYIQKEENLVSSKYFVFFPSCKS